MRALINKLTNKLNSIIIKAKVWKDEKGSPAIESAALIAFVALVVITKADGVGDAIGDAFDTVIEGITDGLSGG